MSVHFGWKVVAATDRLTHQLRFAGKQSGKENGTVARALALPIALAIHHYLGTGKSHIRRSLRFGGGIPKVDEVWKVVWTRTQKL